MGFLASSPVLLLLLLFLSMLLSFTTASSVSARGLDAFLQDYAYRAFVRPRTGIVYDALVPSNFTGISVSAMRLRSGSLRRRGVPMYKDFEIPKGVIEKPYVERLVLVYQNLGNWSVLYYPLPGYMYLAPVLGLLAYNASDLTAKNLPELDIQASDQPIRIKFHDVKSVPHGLAPKCVIFDLQGLPSFSNLLSDSVCATFQQGHFSIVVESTAPSPSPIPVSPAPSAHTPEQGIATPSGEGNGKSSKVGITVGSVVGGVALLVMLTVLLVSLRKFKHRREMQQMEMASEAGVPLHMTTVGNTRAPVATATRTQPVIENNYVP